MFKIFLCSLNKKFTQEEVFSFELSVHVNELDDPESLNVRMNVAQQACDSDKLPEQYKNFSGNNYWMDAIYIE